MEDTQFKMQPMSIMVKDVSISSKSHNQYCYIFVTGAELFVKLNERAAAERDLRDLAKFAQHEAKVVDR